MEDIKLESGERGENKVNRRNMDKILKRYILKNIICGVYSRVYSSQFTVHISHFTEYNENRVGYIYNNWTIDCKHIL